MDKNIVVFPGKHTPVHRLLNPDTSIMCGFNKRALERRTSKEAGYEFTEIALNGQPLFLALRGFKIFKSPRVSRSGGSQGQYLASSANKKDGFLLQYLPPHSVTSKHYHQYTREAFHPLAGSALIHTPWGVEYKLADGKTVVNEPYVIHQVQTRDNDSLVLLEMISELKNPGMKDHIYVGDEDELDIHSKGEYPSCELSNFPAHKFTLDGIVCESMEGFLQALKEKEPAIQKEICRLVGKEAKKKGDEYNATRKPGAPVYWLGKEINRFSQEYQDLLNRAYAELAKDPNFRKALKASGSKILVHTIGGKHQEDTILTETELCTRLIKHRNID